MADHMQQQTAGRRATIYAQQLAEVRDLHKLYVPPEPEAVRKARGKVGIRVVDPTCKECGDDYGDRIVWPCRTAQVVYSATEIRDLLESISRRA